MKNSSKIILIAILAIFFLINSAIPVISGGKKTFFNENKPKVLPSPTSPTVEAVPTLTPSPKPVTASPSPEKSKKDMPKSKPRPPKLPQGAKIHQGQNFHYRILWQGEMAGYSKFFISRRLQLAGDVFYKIESLNELKIGMNRVDHLTFASQTTIRADDLKPTSLQCKQKLGESKVSLECIFSDKLVAQANVSGDSKNASMVPLDDKKRPYVYMTNLWGRYDTLMEHYWLLIRSGKTGKVKVYDPVLRYLGTIEIIRGENTEVEINGIEYSSRIYRISDFKGNLLFKVWVDPCLNILRMQEPGGGLTFEIASSDVVEQFKNIRGVDTWKKRVSQSNTFLINPEQIRTFKAHLMAEGRNVKPEPINIHGYNLNFTPDPQEEQLSDTSPEGKGRQETKPKEKSRHLVKGTITVNTPEINVQDPVKYPVRTAFPPETDVYVRPEFGIESDNDRIYRRSLEAAHKAENVWEAAQKINQWINANIPEGTALPSARMTLENKMGNSQSKALLAIAMCRSLGIPARPAGGLVFSRGNFIPHYWFEVYTGPTGWVPLDPSQKGTNNLGATHILLFRDGDIWSQKVKVVDFSPRPPNRVTFINREITWPVGEKRTFKIKRGEETIGTETALMKEVSVVEDREAYHLAVKTVLDIRGKKTRIEGDYWVTPQGLPVKYNIEITSGNKKEIRKFTRKKDILKQQVTTSQREFSREIPLSRGVYLADTHLLSTWALIAGQLPEPTIGKKYNFTVFIPETLSLKTYNATAVKFESVEAGEKIYETFKVETGEGVTFWLDRKTGVTVRIHFEPQGVDLELISTELKI